MADLSFASSRRQDPLAGAALPQGEGFSITAAPEAARFILRGDVDDVPVFGPATPEKLRASSRDGRVALWLGPDEFLLIAPGDDAQAVRSALESGFETRLRSLVDVSHRQVGYVLEGALAARCLSAGCPLDLRPATFPIGMVARTLFFKTEIILWRQARDRFHVEVWRSFAPYLTGHLAEAHAGTNGLQDQ